MPAALGFSVDGWKSSCCAPRRRGERRGRPAAAGGVESRAVACPAAARCPPLPHAPLLGHPPTLCPDARRPLLGRPLQQRGVQLAATAGAEAPSSGSEVSASAGGYSLLLRPVRTADELRQVATLRADAYYAENNSRFVGSLKKKFVEQEVESLQQRTSILSRGGQPFSECLVALDAASGAVLACIDLRLPKALNGTHPIGVPEDDVHGCYLLNVVVREDARGQGLGSCLMRHAMRRAVGHWAAQMLYTHVEAQNEVAYRLYLSCGFSEHSVDAKYASASKLGQTVLLQAAASQAV